MKTLLAHSARALVLAAAFALAAPAFAQETKPEVAGPTAAAAAPTPSWSNGELQKIGDMLSGSWSANIDGVATVINAAPVAIPGLTDVVYFESARADTPWRPYRQGIWHLAKDSNGTVHLRTMEFRRNSGRLGAAVGTWAAPAAFPGITADDLITTMDLVLQTSGASYSGATAHPYPTSAFDAASMTSSMQLSGDTLSTADRGFDLAGKKVWGPDEGQSYSFTKSDPVANLKDLGEGLYVVEYNTKAQGKTSEDGDIIEVHYVGYLADGKVFDSSYDRGSPMKYPMGQRLIDGWNRAMSDLVPGQHKRLVIPGALAYGERGRPGVIPPNATLFFDIEVVDVQPAPAPAPQPAQPAVVQPGVKPELKDGRTNAEPKVDMKDSKPQ